MQRRLPILCCIDTEELEFDAIQSLGDQQLEGTAGSGRIGHLPVSHKEWIDKVQAGGDEQDARRKIDEYRTLVQAAQQKIEELGPDLAGADQINDAIIAQLPQSSEYTGARDNFVEFHSHAKQAALIHNNTVRRRIADKREKIVAESLEGGLRRG